MTARVVLSPRAQSDLDEIWEYSTDRWGVDQAEKYLRTVWERMQDIATNPAMGEDCSIVRAGYRKIPCGSHVLFYRVIDEGVDIVRVLHERMDYQRHLP